MMRCDELMAEYCRRFTTALHHVAQHVTFDEDPFLWTVYMCISAGLVCMAGLMSGLTLGLMSMDTVELEVLKKTGTAEEKRYAAIIMPVGLGE
jgi:hypothetical protein